VTLDLPGRVPLPDDVRRRALDAVLAGLDDAPPRRRTALPLLAAAVAAVLVVSITVAIGLAGRPAAPAAAPLPPPATAAPALPVTPLSPTPLTDAERCTAVARDLPGTDPRAAEEISVTGSFPLGSDRVLVLDDAIACLATPDTVAVTAPDGAPAGGVTVSRLGPALVVLHNPDLRPVEVAEEPEVTVVGEPGAPVRLVLLSDPGAAARVRLEVAGSSAGPMPEPAPPAAVVRDRDLPARPQGTPEDTALDACLATRGPWQDTRGELFLPVLRHQAGGGRPPVLLARIDDRYAGICTLRPDGSTFVVVPLDLAETVQTAPGGDWSVALLTVPDGARSASVDGDPCSLAGGLALCTGVDEGATVLVEGPDGPTEVLLPPS
jgi:hypothetical protein